MASIHGGVFVTIGVLVGATTFFQPVLWPFRWIAGIFILYGLGKILLSRAQNPKEEPKKHQPHVRHTSHHAPAHHVPHTHSQHPPQHHAHHPQHNPVMAAPHAQMRVCPNCRQHIPAAYRFCPYCGYGV